MLTGTLTNLYAVKSWLSVSISDTDSDALLIRLIRGASEFALNYMNRNTFGRTEYNNQLMDGYGNPFIVLKEWPIIEVTALSVGSRVFNPASGVPLNNGYYLDDTIQNAPQKLTLFGYNFPRARSSINVSYVAGYFVKEELHTVPEEPHSVELYQFWFSTYAVTLTDTDRTPLTYVKADPGDMEYTIDPNSGLHTFNVLQEGVDVYISYSFVPADIVQAVTEIVGERFKAKDRIGYNSKSLGGQETVSFNNQAMSTFTRELLNPYRRVF